MSAVGGLIPVLETPFQLNGDIDVEGFVSVIDHQLAASVDGLMFPGFASEFLKLSDAERDELESALLSKTAGTSVLGIVSVPDHSTELATRRVERAVALGADAINVLPPYLLGPSPAQIVAHLDILLDAAGVVPVVIQLAPALTGAALRVTDLQAIAARHDNFAAVKVESVPPGPTVTALAPIPSVVGYAGLQLIDALRRGAVGVQPGSSFPELYRAILDAWNEGDEARAERLHERLVPYLAYWMQHPELIVQVEKTISMRRGWIQSDYCRRPGRALDSVELATVDRFIELLGSPLGE
jgi:4-hydroxy-tetrahydrodipicolinate synthase